MTKFSEIKRSSIGKLITKFRFGKVVATETETDSLFFFNERYLSRMSSYHLEILAICAPKAKVHFMFRTYFPESYRFSDIIKQSLRQGRVDVTAINRTRTGH